MKPIISADSHITEPANTYVDHIDAKWREKAPRMRYHESLGDAFFVEGLASPVPMGLVAAAGKQNCGLLSKDQRQRSSLVPWAAKYR